MNKFKVKFCAQQRDSPQCAMASSDDTSDQYAQLRRAIKHQLQQLGVGQEVHSLLLELSQRPGAANLTPTSVLELLEGKGLVKQLANNIGPPNKALTSLLSVSEQLGEEPAPQPSGAKCVGASTSLQAAVHQGCKWAASASACSTLFRNVSRCLLLQAAAACQGAGCSWVCGVCGASASAW